ncbi:helicase-associated domain-containing protein [Gordonia sp. VNQ95]|uniref:helicase-associated domain-containing protein n=1 Tax=Gordonia sp. VNQ95 TaxID=3156619 RepID=UPI0032B3CCC3
MSPDSRASALADDLASRSDAELADLITLRPDLASPPPQGTQVLAQRALSPASAALAGESLDLLGLAVLEVLIDLGPPESDTVSLPAVRSALADRADADEVEVRVDLLRRLALIWGPDDALHIGAHAASALPWRGLHLIGPPAERTAAELTRRLAALDERERELLGALSRGPALGRSRDAAPDADPAAPVARLIADGMLARIDHQTVELPPQLGQLLRDEPPLQTDNLRRPRPEDDSGSRRFSARDVDAAAGGEALEAIRHATALLRVLGATPAAVLRSGALGVRELRRLTKATGLDQQRVALLIEILGHARLIDAGFPDPPPPGDTGEHVFAPTTTVDTWLHQPRERQWYTLVEAWLTMPRRAWQVGEPDRDGTAIPALSGDNYDAHAPAQRRTILSAMALGPTAAPVSVAGLVSLLAWQHPHQMRRLGSHVVEHTLREAREMGLVAHHALSSVGRAILEADAGADDAPIVAAMRTALPEPVDHFLTQADLTITVPGPMTPELAEQVEMVADLESGGAASVYRVSEVSVRRALDAGRSSSELIAMFTAHSRTPVPQSLTYLIEDVARRHGQLRVGIASSFIRCEDAATLAAVLRSEAAAHLSMRALAPTVAVSPSEIRDVLDSLRAAGFAPSGEDSSGELVDMRERGSRVPVTRARRHAIPPRRAALNDDQVLAVIGRLRSGDRAATARPASASASVRAGGNGETATALIQLALRAHRRLRVGYVDAHGSASQHVVTPQALGSGQLIGVEDGTDDEQRFSLHRITSVELLDT